MVKMKIKPWKLLCENFRIVPAGYMKAKIIYFRKSESKRPSSIIVDRTPDVEWLMNKTIVQKDCALLYKIIKQKKNERHDQRSFTKRTRKSKE